MHIYYEDGPPKITMGAAGEFRKGVSREIEDGLAKMILEKKTVVFKEGEAKEPDLPKEPENPPGLPGAGKKVKEVPTNGSN
ncbi:MAG: hypothetical protein A2075_12205 [Geobacteraceae bacterium GWC2_58_44]|nr:MAG: hypothetical protein A2075_12205 [Geobacteraceae bacterium GWC2_58_44]HBG06325.1 hypothetical protein [Geobacter sp.]